MDRSRMDDGDWRREWEDEQRLTPQEEQEKARQEAEDREMDELLHRLYLQDLADEEDEQRRAWEGHGGFDDLSYLNDDDYEGDFDLDDNMGRSICGPRESEGW